MENTTTAPAHTPEPWIYSHSQNPDVYTNELHWLVLSHPVESTGVAIADIEGGLTPEAEANARLIAAAPELLECLVAVNDYLWRPPWERDPKVAEALEQQAEAVIAKATGTEHGHTA